MDRRNISTVAVVSVCWQEFLLLLLAWHFFPVCSPLYILRLVYHSDFRSRRERECFFRSFSSGELGVCLTENKKENKKDIRKQLNVL